MSPIFYQQIINDVVEKAIKKRHPGAKVPKKLLERESRNLIFDVTRFFKDVLFILIGVVPSFSLVKMCLRLSPMTISAVV